MQGNISFGAGFPGYDLNITDNDNSYLPKLFGKLLLYRLLLQHNLEISNIITFALMIINSRYTKSHGKQVINYVRLERLE